MNTKYLYELKPKERFRFRYQVSRDDVFQVESHLTNLIEVSQVGKANSFEVYHPKTLVIPA